MGELGLNKIFGSILAAALGVMGLQQISSMVFSSGGHHGHHGEKKPYCESVKDDNAYYVDVPCEGNIEPSVVEIYDLGLLLAGADAAKGERTFKSVCASCHTIDQGGADGTGPNLYGIINKEIAGTAGFGYSAALQGVDGAWTYEVIDQWIQDPANIARGVNMVANVKRDPDRANLIAYLASNTPDAPAFPAPLPEEGEAADEAVIDGVVAEEISEAREENAADAPVDAGTETPENGSALDEMEDIVERMEDGVEDLTDEMEAAGESVNGMEMPPEPVQPEEDPAELVPDPQ